MAVQMNKEKILNILIPFVILQVVCLAGLAFLFFSDSANQKKTDVVQQHVYQKIDDLFDETIDKCTRFFAANADGRTMPLVALSEPMVNSNRMQSWIGQSVIDILSFDFDSHKKHMTRSRGYFTESGWASFQAEIEKDALVKTLQSKRYILSAAPAEQPILISEGKQKTGGEYRWVYEIPVVLSYANVKDAKARTVNLRVEIKRVSVKENINGYAIHGWVMI